MSTKRRKAVQHGNVDFTAEDFASAATRQRISIMVPLDVLKRLRELAAKEGVGYQTLANRLLREAVSGGSITERLERIERAVGARG